MKTNKEVLDADYQRVRLEFQAELQKEQYRAMELRKELLQVERRIRWYERHLQSSNEENN